MKKISKIFFLSLLLFCLSALSSFAASTLEFTIGQTQMNKKTDTIESSTLLAAPYIQNNRTMIPVRSLCEAFGGEVSWDDTSKTATVILQDKKVSVTLGKSEIVVNGVSHQIDCSAEIVNSTIFIPLRAVSENLGYYVYYVDATKQILVDDTPPVFTVGKSAAPYNMVLAMYDMNKYTSEDTDDQTMLEYANYNIALSSYQYLDNMYSKIEILGDGTVLSEKDKEDLIAFVGDKTNYPADTVLSATFAKILQDSTLADIYTDAFLSSIEVPVEEVEKAYSEQYVCAKHVLIASGESRSDDEAKELADIVYQRAAAGEDFDLLVDEYGEDPGMVNNAEGYIFTKNEMVAEFEEATFALQNGQISEPVKTSYGYHVIMRLPLPSNSSAFKALRETMLIDYANSIFESENEKLEFVINISPDDFFISANEISEN